MMPNMSSMMIGKYLPVLSDQVPDHFDQGALHNGHPQHVEDAVGVMKPTQQYL